MSDKELIGVLYERIADLLLRVSAVEQINAELREENRNLKAELAYYKSGRNSGNSHLPPSSIIGGRSVVKRKKKKSSRNPGGQMGHKASRLEQVDQPDEVVIHDVGTCSGCGEDLSHQPGEVLRKGQLFDIPKIEIRVLEHHKIRKICPVCQKTTDSMLPGTLDYYDAQYGDNLKNLVTYMSSRQYCSVTRIIELVRIVTGTNISTGFVWETVHHKAQDLKSTYDDLIARLKQSWVVGSDETGCKMAGKKGWMWVWVNSAYVYLRASTNRGYATITDVLGEEKKSFTLVSDCYNAQLKTECSQRQLCLAHLLRECEGLFEKSRSKWALNLKAKIGEILKLTKRKKIPDAKIKKLESDIEALLKCPSGSLPHKAAVLKDRLWKYKTSLTTCLRDRDVPPTNNWSERALRSTKVKLRVSSQFRTHEGAQDYAILRSIIDSAILQGKNPFDALIQPQILLI